jgi:phage shock protein PspC (stress-responsive transcriptional regulator)
MELEEKLLRSQKMESLGLLAGGVAQGCGTYLDILITYFAIVLTCFPLQFFHRGLRIGLLCILSASLHSVMF